ncbi:MAG: polyphosphate kinase [Saprospiraceae bacterium]|nr:polyphosphate kinase [Saprospiraceae bacterium]MCB9323212.1 polyphosphate kinase [Lewinellaceae bacterium]
MIKIKDLPTDPPVDLSKKDIQAETKALTKRLAELQYLLAAEKKHSVLVILQGMDGSGKDGAATKVFKYCQPSGIHTYSFKKPSEEEFAHDFLWRVHKQAPEKGIIKIFNRSHYEDILIQRVHKWITEEKVEKRMIAINAFEELLAFDNNTLILKFFLNISYEQQEIELQQRIDDPTKQWKHNDNDWKEREQWEEYMTCYQYILNESTLPWTIVPVDSRWYRDYIIAKKMVESLEALNMQFPVLKR